MTNFDEWLNPLYSVKSLPIEETNFTYSTLGTIHLPQQVIHPQSSELLSPTVRSDFHNKSLLNTREEILPGIFDILNFFTDEKAKEILYYYHDYAENYLTKQLYDFYRQSDESLKYFKDVIFEQEGRIKIEKTFIDRLLEYVEGFTDDGSEEKELRLPVVALNYPHNTCKIEINFTSLEQSSVIFKLSVPGIAGGFGKKRNLEFHTRSTELTQNIQCQVKAKARLKKFRRGSTTHWLLQILDILPSFFVYGHDDEEFYQIPEPNQKIEHYAFGVKAGSTETISNIDIKEGYSAIFSINLNKLLVNNSELDLPNISDFSLDYRSESHSSLGFNFHHEANKEYVLKGANKNSLHLFIEEV